MTRRWCLLGLALVVVALTSDAKPVTFIQPVRLVVLPPYGGTEIPVQTRIPVTVDNRAWRLEWDGDACAGGSSVRELHGADDPAIMPAERPLEVRVFAGGVCGFAAAVFDGRGRILARGDIAVHTGTPAVTQAARWRSRQSRMERIGVLAWNVLEYSLPRTRTNAR